MILKAMFDHMYTDKNTHKTNKDYIGGFYIITMVIMCITMLQGVKV